MLDISIPSKKRSDNNLNVLLNPSSSSVKIFERSTWESWEDTFQLVADDIFNELHKKLKT